MECNRASRSLKVAERMHEPEDEATAFECDEDDEGDEMMMERMVKHKR